MPKLYLAWQRLEGADAHEMGRQLLGQLYRTHVDDRMPEIRIAPRGKPCFADSPWHFSISHCKGHVFCLLADCPVGIDAEEQDRTVDPGIAPKILSPGELAQWRASPDPKQTLLRFWVLKEADAKRTGEGIRLHPNHTNFTLPDSRIREIDGCVVAIIY